MKKVKPLSSWTFLSNHGHILIHLHNSPDARVRDIASAVGITERSALSILSDLENEGYIAVERVGRRNHYRINPDKKFRHPLEAQKPLSLLLKIFSPK
jgi:predicted ArsR family transcriptional regulator